MKIDTVQNITNNRPFRHRYLNPFVLITLLGFIFLVLFIFALKSTYSSKSDIVIRIAAAGILNKEPNDLTDEDFRKITELTLDGKELSDIKLLGKFTNLKELYLANIHPPKTRMPRWMSLLAKLRILDPSKKKLIDLSPLEKLSNLEIVTLIGSSVKDIKPLANLKNLKFLNLNETQVSDIKPVENLANLQGLYLSKTSVSDIEPIKSLTELKSLYLEDTGVSDLEPVRSLVGLMQLRLKDTKVTLLEPLSNLNNLQKLYLENCRNVKRNEIEDLRKALPDLYIYQTPNF